MDSIKLYKEMLVITKKNHTVLLTSNEEIQKRNYNKTLVTNSV